MPFTNTQYKEVGIGNGAGSQTFTIPFAYQASTAQTDIIVYEIDSTDLSAAPVYKTNPTHFTVNTSTDEIEATGSWTPASGIEVHYERSSARKQAVDFPNSGAFSSAGADEAHDRLENRVREAEGRAAFPMYPQVGPAATQTALTTSQVAFFTTEAIDAPAGMSGTLVSVFMKFYTSVDGTVETDDGIGVQIHTGPLGTVSDPIDPYGAGFYAAFTDRGLTTVTHFAGMIRVDDGDYLTVSLSRVGVTGFLNCYEHLSCLQVFHTGSY